MQGPSPGTSAAHGAGRASPKKQDENVPWNKSWKLRKALQHEQEKQQSHNHPDERHITRVVQMEQQPKRSSPGFPKEIPNM